MRTLTEHVRRGIRLKFNLSYRISRIYNISHECMHIEFMKVASYKNLNPVEFVLSKI